ncbi:MAG: CMGC protein kinase [Amphiamblys sp. WSBS2006]|nr:MAG: CMGC protein kinase [Amphiamblys sp. WSBS2006]
MAGKRLKHLLLFFLSASEIVGAADESVMDTDKPAEYREDDYEKLGQLGTYWYGTVYKVREKKTGKIYVLKRLGPSKHEYAENEVRALQQLGHRNIVKMIANNIEARSEDGPVHIVLEYMPCDLKYAALNHPEIKEKTREILYQILEGVAHIHSKKLAHNDKNLENILIDPAMAVKICDFGLCREGEGKEFFLGMSMDGYRRDISSVGCIMAHLYLGGDFSRYLYTDFFTIHGLELLLQTKREGGVLPDNSLGTLYKEMEEVVSVNGMDLFLKLLVSKRTGGYTTAAKILEHPFFAEGREEDLPFWQRMPLKFKQQLCASQNQEVFLFLMQGL